MITKVINTIPTDIKLLQKSRVVEITFDNGEHFSLPCKLLRQRSPAADNKQPEALKVKDDINIIGIEPVGNYAVKLIFDDGYQTGIYSWKLLYELGVDLPCPSL